MLQPIARFARIADQESKRWRMKRLCKVVHEVVTSDVCCNLGCANLWQGTSRTLQTGVPVLLTRLHLLCVPHLVDTGRIFHLPASVFGFSGFSPTSIKNLKNWCFLPLTLSGPLSKQTVIVCDLCLLGFDPGLCVFLGSLLSSLSRFGRVFLKVLPQL